MAAAKTRTKAKTTAKAAKTAKAVKPAKTVKAAKTAKAAKPAKTVKAATPGRSTRRAAPSRRGVDVVGKTVVLTGTLTGMERGDAENRLTALGARVTSAVSRHTDLLFVGATGAGSKVATAEALGIPIHDEAALFALVGAPATPPRAPAPPPTAAAKQKVAERAADPSDGLAGKTVVLTGTLSRPRVAIEKALEAAGARVTGSVSANTHFLVAGPDAGSKLATATALGVPVLDEATLHAMLARRR